VRKEMSKQEGLQRVIDILSDNIAEMSEIDYGGSLDSTYINSNMDGIQTVAKEITKIFHQSTQKDTRSRRERALDTEFERMGVKPYIYHFTKKVYPFSAITIAHTFWRKIVLMYILDDIFMQNSLWMRGCSPATQMFRELASKKIYGVAICDKTDAHNKTYARTKAKGRLMQYLLKEQQK